MYRCATLWQQTWKLITCQSLFIAGLLGETRLGQSWRRRRRHCVRRWRSKLIFVSSWNSSWRVCQQVALDRRQQQQLHIKRISSSSSSRRRLSILNIRELIVNYCLLRCVWHHGGIIAAVGRGIEAASFWWLHLASCCDPTFPLSTPLQAADWWKSF